MVAFNGHLDTRQSISMNVEAHHTPPSRSPCFLLCSFGYQGTKVRETRQNPSHLDPKQHIKETAGDTYFIGDQGESRWSSHRQYLFLSECFTETLWTIGVRLCDLS